MSHVWQEMLKIKEYVGDLGETAKYVNEMLDIIVSDNVNLKGDLVKRSRQVDSLETKLGSIHSVDFHDSARQYPN